ncbi:MAG: hypothetical protein AB1816_15130 [Bacillota bacterium]
MSAAEVAVAVLLINIPFGYWRAAVPRLSREWIAAVHLPVPVVILLRIASGLGWKWATFPLLVGAFFLGQLAGGQVRRLTSRLPWWQDSACLAWDLVRACGVRGRGRG